MTRYEANLVWIDLEMTGLDSSHDVILEIATVVTSNQLELIAQGPTLVIHQPDEILALMDEWVTRIHTKSNLVTAVRQSVVSLEQAEEATLAFLMQYAQKNLSPLCGNSVWQDRIFLSKYMPRIIDYLNYRIIDVSSIKEVVKRWYPQSPYENFVKAENHRAQEDILQSIEELKHYRTYFFCQPS